jgi:hypothetical protein
MSAPSNAPAQPHRAIGRLTSGALAAICALHVAWGFGSSFPARTHGGLGDNVVGSDRIPPPAACFAVAGALAVASTLVADGPPVPRRLRPLGRVTLAGVLAVRGGFGLAGRTDLLVPGSTSASFRRNDRRYFAPLCLALATGVLASRPRRAR